jgi:chromosome segregation ATPase
MKERNKSGLRGVVVRTVLTVVIAVMVPELAGCGKQLTAIEENQLQLQGMVQDHTQQIEENQLILRGMVHANAQQIAGIERNQHKLQGTMKTNAQQMAQNISGIEQNQSELGNDIEGHLNRLMESIAMIESSQNQLRGGISNNTKQLSKNTVAVAAAERGLAEVREIVTQVQNSTNAVTTKVAGLEENQVKLYGEIESSIRQIISNVATIEQSLQELKKMVANVRNDTEKTATTTVAIERQQRIVENNMRQIVKNTKAIEQLKVGLLPAELSEATAAKPSSPPAESTE